MAAGLKISPRWRKAGDPAVGGGGFGDLPVVPTDPRTGRWWRRAWGRPVTVAGPRTDPVTVAGPGTGR